MQQGELRPQDDLAGARRTQSAARWVVVVDSLRSRAGHVRKTRIVDPGATEEETIDARIGIGEPGARYQVDAAAPIEQVAPSGDGMARSLHDAVLLVAIRL